MRDGTGQTNFDSLERLVMQMEGIVLSWWANEGSRKRVRQYGQIKEAPVREPLKSSSLELDLEHQLALELNDACRRQVGEE
jgi:hypothetical protein